MLLAASAIKTITKSLDHQICPALDIAFPQRYFVKIENKERPFLMAVSTIKTIKPIRKNAKPYLPESDGKPMAETDTHRQQMIDLLDSLEEYFRSDPNVYVTGNIFLYLPRDEESGEQQSVSPDVFVVRGIKKKIRRIYNMEIEKKAPDVIIELISRSTRLDDLGNKKVLYAEMGVTEYFIFDPLKETFPDQLRGFRLKDAEYIPREGTPLRSEILGLDLVVENGRLRLYDVKAGERLRTHEEAEADRRAAEAEVARLRQELARLQQKTKK